MSAKAQISVPCDPDWKREVEAAAKAVRRPMAFWIRDAVEAALANTGRRVEQPQSGGARAA